MTTQLDLNQYSIFNSIVVPIVTLRLGRVSCWSICRSTPTFWVSFWTFGRFLFNHFPSFYAIESRLRNEIRANQYFWKHLDHRNHFHWHWKTNNMITKKLWRMMEKKNIRMKVISKLTWHWLENFFKSWNIIKSSNQLNNIKCRFIMNFCLCLLLCSDQPIMKFDGISRNLVNR